MNESPVPRRRTPLTWTLLISWMAIHALALGMSGWKLASETWWTFGSPAPDVLVRLGAEIPALIRLGEWQRFLTHAFVHVFALHVLLNAWVFSALGGMLESAIGAARTWIVFVVAAVGGGVAHFVFRADPGAGASGGVFGVAGALGVWALFSKHPQAPAAGRTVLIFLILTGALLLVPNMARVAHEAHYGGLVAGALTMLVLGPKRSSAAPGLGVRIVAGLLVVLALAAGTRQVLAGGVGGADEARALATEVRAAEKEARYLYERPRVATPQRRAELGRRLDLVLTAPLLDRWEGAAALRAYIEAWRPVATADIPDPFAFEAALAQALEAWRPYAKRLYLEAGLPSGP